MSYSTHARMHTVLLHHCLFAAYTHTIAACSAVIPVLCKNLNGFKFWHHFNWQFITTSLESPPGFSPSHLIPISVILALLFLWLALPLLLTHHSHHPLPLYSFTPGWKPSFSAHPSHHSLSFFRADSTDSLAVLLLLSISVFKVLLVPPFSRF